MKILLIGMSNVLGGIEVYCYNLIKNKPNNISFDLLFFDNQVLPYEKELVSMGVNILRICPRRINRKKSRSDLINILLKNNYDIVHYHIMSFSWYEPILLSYKYSKTKIIVHVHSALVYGFKNYIFNFIGRLRSFHVLFYKVACGKKAGDYFFKNDYEIFYNGIDFDKYKFDGNSRMIIRKELNIDSNVKVYGIVSRLVKMKNILFLIDIFKDIKKNDKNSKLLLVGEGNLKDKVEKKIKKYNLEDSVLLLGKRENINELLSSIDVFLMPSLYEGLSIALIEAQVNGLKCYTSSSVDYSSNISGNVSFISLRKSSSKWARIILKNDNLRDLNVLNKLSYDYNVRESSRKVYEFYDSILK